MAAAPEHRETPLCVADGFAELLRAGEVRLDLRMTEAERVGQNREEREPDGELRLPGLVRGQPRQERERAERERPGLVAGAAPGRRRDRAAVVTNGAARVAAALEVIGEHRCDLAAARWASSRRAASRRLALARGRDPRGKDLAMERVSEAEARSDGAVGPLADAGACQEERAPRELVARFLDGNELRVERRRRLRGGELAARGARRLEQARVGRLERVDLERDALGEALGQLGALPGAAPESRSACR